ncbi:MAG: hypothetical protein E6K53_12170 [Gammaproteobacteria bacterium]|nr:MAG: hypothetical protein E6K53_12170 [Gammaproteobacteria bacterium]
MRIQGQLVEDDYAAAQFLHMRPSLPNAIVAAVLVIGVLAMIAFDHSKASFGALGALIFIAAILFVYTPWRARRTFREYKALSEPVSYEIREDGLHAKRTHGEGLVQWSELLRWK